jgi:hypothetical protein
MVKGRCWARDIYDVHVSSIKRGGGTCYGVILHISLRVVRRCFLFGGFSTQNLSAGVSLKIRLDIKRRNGYFKTSRNIS